MANSAGCEYCPICIKSGSLKRLLRVETTVGKIENLCSSPTCFYPFRGYDSLAKSLHKSQVNTDPGYLESMDDFFNEILGCSTNSTVAAPEFESVCSPHRLPDCGQSLSGSLKYAHRENITVMNDCRPICSSTSDEMHIASVKSNCLLPRYLADNMKLATSEQNSNRYTFSQSSVHSKPSRITNGSNDSGISISSLASQCSPLSTREDREQCLVITPGSKNVDKRSSNDQCDPSLSSTKRRFSSMFDYSPLTPVGRMLRSHQEHLQ